jgi:lysophospholipase L1-like esterase
MTPIPNQFVLMETEIADINNTIEAYNEKLKATANALGLAFVDVNEFMSRIKTGIIYNGVNVSAEFVAGGAFSLDGVHLSPLGNALMANEFIKAINQKYGVSIPQVNATKYKGVEFP